jgi:hypothetical protein
MTVQKTDWVDRSETRHKPLGQLFLSVPGDSELVLANRDTLFCGVVLMGFSGRRTMPEAGFEPKTGGCGQLRLPLVKGEKPACSDGEGQGHMDDIQ